MKKEVHQYDLEGNHVNSFLSITEAADHYEKDESVVRKVIDKYPDRSAIGSYWSLFKRDNLFDGYLIGYPTREEIETFNLYGNTLVIGDLHEPFTLKEYLSFAKAIYNKYKCKNVVFIGDLIDNHYSSFHDTNPDGHSAAQEFIKAKANIQKWYDTFPNAFVTVGNHDQILDRRGFNSGVSSMWIKSLSEVLETPGWKYSEAFIINGVLFTHGTGRKAKQRSIKDMISVVQGHYHSESYIHFNQGITDNTFAMQIGAGMDDKSYAAAYGRFGNKTHVNVGVILEGNVPLIEYM